MNFEAMTPEEKILALGFVLDFFVVASLLVLVGCLKKRNGKEASGGPLIGMLLFLAIGLTLAYLGMWIFLRFLT